MKRKTTKHRRHSPQSVLQVRVYTPRIAWFGFLRLAGSLAKIACVLAVIGGIGWGVWWGIQQAFFKNPDFRLQVLDLNPNPVIDELGVAAAAGIDLTASPSLFDIDVTDVAAKLKQLPEINEVRVERHLPGTLMVRIIPRSPKAWVSCPAAGVSEVRLAGAMLLDTDGVAYPCPPMQLESAIALPVVELPAREDQPIKVGEKIKQPELEYCFMLLDSAREADPDALKWIESIRPINDWSLELVTRQGTSATFGLGDHDRQIESLRAALDHAGEKGYVIDTINLIPKYNIPITLRGEPAAPRAVPVAEPSPGDAVRDRRARDLNNLLQRN
jgi:hypothetical protein